MVIGATMLVMLAKNVENGSVAEDASDESSTIFAGELSAEARSLKSGR
jgi:hypothetical protein